MHMPPQVSVGDYSDQEAAWIRYADTTESLRGHFEDRVRHPRTKRRKRHGCAGMHDIAHRFEQGPKFSAGMKQTEIDSREAMAFEKRDRQGVAEGELHEGRCCRGEVVRASLTRLRQSQYDIRNLGQCTVRDGGHRNQLDSMTARIIG